MAELRERERCIGLTKQGTRCKNVASEGSSFCWRHQQEGCAKQVGELVPQRPAPSPPRKATSPRRSPSPERSPRAAAAPVATTAPTNLAWPAAGHPGYFDQLDDATLQIVCDKLAERNDYQSLGRLISSGKRFRALCQASLDKLEEPPTKVDKDGTMRWKDSKGRLHRSRDKPAVIYFDGTQKWYWRGRQHREGDKPAYIMANGAQEWFWHGQLHREGDKPAVIGADGSQKWYQHNQPHRDGDKPAYIGADGMQLWWWHGQPHRRGDQPAAIWPSGAREWWPSGAHSV